MTRSDRKDLTGMTFGNLTAVGQAGNDKRGYAVWACTCSCGKSVAVTSRWLTTGQKKSCNVDGHRWAGSDQKKRDTLRSLHYVEYTAWKHMRFRCEKPSDSSYKNYGARGITVCERWQSFKNFFADMGPKPSPSHSIERKNNNGNYEPGNCVWATPKEQARNQRRTIFVEWEGRRITLAALIERLGLNPSLIYSRLKIGWTLEKALTTPGRLYTPSFKQKGDFE